MKALIRNPGETILESDNIPGIEWDTGYPLTASGWAGGPYVLVNDYVPTIGEEDVEFEIQERGTGRAYYLGGFNDPEPETETVTIDGKEYTRAELLALLDQTN